MFPVIVRVDNNWNRRAKPTIRIDVRIGYLSDLLDVAKRSKVERPSWSIRIRAVAQYR